MREPLRYTSDLTYGLRELAFPVPSTKLSLVLYLLSNPANGVGEYLFTQTSCLED